MRDEGSPSAADVEKLVGRLKVEPLANESELVVLELLERLGPGDVLDDARGVDHARSEEPLVEVVTSCESRAEGRRKGDQ